MKIGLVGLGYWGKIILRNLIELGYRDITVCEQQRVDWSQIGSKFPLVKDYKKLDCDAVFVVVPARWDLASHDVSIGCYLLDEKPEEVKWMDFKRLKESDQNDSVVGILNFSKTTLQINASWAYGMKNRMCIFEFDNGFLYWDDTTTTLLYGNDILQVDKCSPLHSAINTFLSGFSKEEQEEQKKLTMITTEILNA